MKLVIMEHIYGKNDNFGKVKDGRHSGAITPKGYTSQMANIDFLTL